MTVRDLSRDSSLDDRREEPELRIFLRTSEGEPLDGLLGRLAHLFGLDVYGTSLLGRRARLEMKFAALLLLVVVTFDLAAWSLLFNAIFHPQILTLSRWTFAAVFAGALLSCVVFLYERQFLTTDPSRIGWRLSIPIVTRLLIVVAAALITAQPVELLFFRSAISERAHREGVRKELTARLGAIAEMEEVAEELRLARAALPGSPELGIELSERRAAAERLSELSEQRIRKDAERDRAQREAERAAEEERNRGAVAARLRRELERTETLASSPSDGLEQVAALERARSELRRAQTAHAAAARRHQAHAARALALSEEAEVVGALKEEATLAWDIADREYDTRRAALEEQIDGQMASIDAERERLRDWIRRLRGVEPGETEPIVEQATLAGATPYDYRFPRYHFFEQLRVLGDLRSGRPPLWEGADRRTRQELASEFGLVDPEECGKAGASEGCDPLEWDRHLAATRAIRWAYFVVYAIALVIPLLVLALKFLLPAELAVYYSSVEQRRIGNAEAVPPPGRG